MTQLSLGQRTGDFLIHIESPQKNFTYGQLTMPGSGGPHTKANVVGLPLKANNVVALATEEASVVAFVAAGEPLDAVANGAATTGPLYTIIDRWDGVVINQDAMMTTDTQATPVAYTNATIRTTLAALTTGATPKFVEEPDNQTEQTD